MKSKSSHVSAYVLWTGIILAVLAVAFFLLKFLAAPSHKTDARGKNLLIISLDTTRADRIGAYGYSAAQTPHIDKLAAGGVTFEDCQSAVPVTLPAHASLFTGRYPLGHGVRDNGTFFLDNNETTLAEIFKEMPEGYQTYAVIAAFVLMSKFGLNQGFDFYDDSLKIGDLITNFDSEIIAEDVYKKFNSWFDKRNKQKAGPFFAWVHFYDPHVPYAPPEPFKSRFKDDLQGRYDGEIAYTDSYVGKIMEDLENAGVLDETLVVVVGDHGEAFGEHQEFGHSLFCYRENLQVPLIFYNPAILEKGLRIPNRVSIVDVMPTLLELYGIQPSESVQGKSLLPLLSGAGEKKERTLYIESMHGKEEFGWAPLTGIIDGNYKYISLPQPELYDLAADNREKENLFFKKNVLAKQLDKKLMRLVKTCSASPGGGKTGGSQRQLSSGDRQHLQSLGYISAFSVGAATNLDPKKGILLKNRLRQIDGKIDNDHLDQALADLETMARENPKTLLPQYYGSLNRIYKKQNQPGLVIENWKNAITAFPGNDHFKINLAFEYFQSGNLEDAAGVADDILKNNDKYTRAYILKGKINERLDNLEESLGFFEKAAALEPQNASLQAGFARLLGKTRRFKRAAEICDRLLSDDSVKHNLSVKAKIGEVLTEIRRDDSALQLLNEVAAAGKASAETWNYLGILRYRKKMFKEAEEAYLKSLEMDNASALTYNNMGALYLSMFVASKDAQLHNNAMRAFTSALKINPKLASALNGRASAYKFVNRVPEAIKDWRLALESKPGFTDVYFNLAVTYLQINDKTNALDILNRCKEKFQHRLPPPVKQRLDRLIRQAEG